MPDITGMKLGTYRMVSLTTLPASGETKYLGSNSSGNVVLMDDPSTNHGELTGLSDDDHSQYVLLAGRSGGQTIIGDTVSSGNLTLQSTTHAVRGQVRANDPIFNTLDSYSSALASLTVTSETDSVVTIQVDESLTAEINKTNGLVWDIQVLENSNIRTLINGKCNIVNDVTRSTS